MMPETAKFRRRRRCESLAEGIAGVDVVMMLRIQHERPAAGRWTCRPTTATSG